MSAHIKKLLSIVISTIILILIYSKIDLERLPDIFRNCHKGWLGLSLLMFIPIIFIISKRLQVLTPKNAQVNLAESIKLILSASVLNLILPSKMGDIAKAYFLAEKGNISGSLSLSLMIYEKTCDMLALLVWCIMGFILLPYKNNMMWCFFVILVLGFAMGVLMIISKWFPMRSFQLIKHMSPGYFEYKIKKLESAWIEMCKYVIQDKRLLVKVSVISMFVWFLHLVQIWFFIFMLNSSVPFVQHLVRAPLSIFAGLIPVTFAGIGTRDAALIFFYKDYLEVSVAAVLGLMCTSRYLIPAVFGLPFFNQYLLKIKTNHENTKKGKNNLTAKTQSAQRKIECPSGKGQ